MIASIFELNTQRLRGFKGTARDDGWHLDTSRACLPKKAPLCSRASCLCSASLVSQKAEDTFCLSENQWFSKLISACYCNWIIKSSVLQDLRKASKLESCTVTEHKSNTSNSIWHFNCKSGKTPSLQKQSKLARCESDSLEDTSPPCAPLGGTAAGAASIMQTKAAAAITSHLFPLPNCTISHGVFL